MIARTHPVAHIIKGHQRHIGMISIMAISIFCLEIIAALRIENAITPHYWLRTPFPQTANWVGASYYLLFICFCVMVNKVWTMFSSPTIKRRKIDGQDRILAQFRSVEWIDITNSFLDTSFIPLEKVFVTVEVDDVRTGDAITLPVGTTQIEPFPYITPDNGYFVKLKSDIRMYFSVAVGFWLTCLIPPTVWLFITFSLTK